MEKMGSEQLGVVPLPFSVTVVGKQGKKGTTIFSEGVIKKAALG